MSIPSWFRSPEMAALAHKHGQAMQARWAAQSEARAQYRAHGIHGDDELFAALTNIEANCTDGEHREKLRALLLAMDDAIHANDPELIGCDKRGEYDAQTVGVRNKS